MDSHARAFLLSVGIGIFLAPSLAHAHGFPWWFGVMVLTPFMVLPVLIAIPCKTWFLHLVGLNGNRFFFFKGALTLMVLDLAVIIVSYCLYSTVNPPIKKYFFGLIDSSFGWNLRATFRGTFDNILGLLMGFSLTIFCAGISWFPHYRVLRKRVSKSSSLGGDGRSVSLWAFILACVGPSLFWFIACLRLV
jgi:hypothetical protein